MRSTQKRKFKDRDTRIKELGLTGLDMKKAKTSSNFRKQSKNLVVQKLNFLDNPALFSGTKKSSLTDRGRVELSEFKRKKKKHMMNQLKKLSKEKEKKKTKIKRNLEILEMKAKNLAKSRSKKKLRTMNKSRSTADLSSNMTKQLIAYLKENNTLSESSMHKEFEKIYINYKQVMSGITPKTSKGSKKSISRHSSKPHLLPKYLRGNGSSAGSGDMISIGEKFSATHTANFPLPKERKSKSKDKTGRKSKKRNNFKKKTAPTKVRNKSLNE
jgi:hypothetical protein